jgi:hypothetical protein
MVTISLLIVCVTSTCCKLWNETSKATSIRLFSWDAYMRCRLDFPHFAFMDEEFPKQDILGCNWKLVEKCTAKGLLSHLRLHCNRHPLIPNDVTHSFLDCASIYFQWLKEMFLYCKSHALPSIWVYLWTNWYYKNEFQHWALSNIPLVPSLVPRCSRRRIGEHLSAIFSPRTTNRYVPFFIVLYFRSVFPDVSTWWSLENGFHDFHIVRKVFVFFGAQEPSALRWQWTWLREFNKELKQIKGVACQWNYLPHRSSPLVLFRPFIFILEQTL